MTERFWKNLSMVSGWLAIGVFFGLAVFVSSLEIKDLDLWLHLRMGHWISHHWFVPDFDVLSCTIFGKPWVNHEWLFQVLVYQIQSHFGFDALITMQSLVVALMFVVLLFLGYSKDNQWITVFTLLMVLMVYQTRFTIRPDIFSLLFFVLNIYILSLHINQRWAMYALVLLQILWTNMHGFFFFGPLLVGLGLVAEFIKRRVPLPWEWNTTGRLNDEEYRKLKIVFPVLLLACCVNPGTIHGALYPLKVFFHLAQENKIFFHHILELQKPVDAKTIFTDKYFHYKVLIILSAVSFVFNRRKIDISSLLIWIVFLLFSLAAIRNLIYFAVAAFLVIMVNVISISWETLVPIRFTAPKFKFITGIMCKAMIIGWMLNFGLQISSNGYFDFDTFHRKSEFLGISKRVYPYKAVDFLIRQKINGNFFNDFNSGAYLLGRTSPHIKVFIDGRTEVYGAAFFQEYMKIWQEGQVKTFQSYERKYHITGAFLNNTRQQIPSAVLKMFYSFKNWTMVYLDEDAVIFLKQTPQNKALIDRYAVDLKKWKVRPLDLLGLGTRPVDPYIFTNRAYILETLGFDDAALLECKEALKFSADYGPAYNIMGKIYNRKKDFKKAFEYCRLGAMYTGDLQTKIGLAQAYEGLRNFQGALAQYQKVLDASPRDVSGYFGKARVYAQMGEEKKALDMLQAASKLGIEDKVDVQRIHDIINDKKGAAPKKKH
ncbi:MAG: tetratricopeptide repeat protein [Candidatus Omnitrophica bacterium]|nr:tetratricopeptide repeat protein [Candidatus Omnitrophota bacterium]